MLSSISFVHWLVILSIPVSLYGSVVYVRDTLRGKTKPNRVTWGMWALAPLVGVVVALSAEADPWVTSRIFLAGFVPLIIFTLSFVNKQSYWKLTIFDVLCGVFSLLALVLWLGVDSTSLAVLLSVLADAFAALPTIIKAWKNPETETGFTFIMGLVSVLLILPSIGKWDILNSAFQIYFLVVNIILIFSVYRKRIFKYIIDL